MPDHDPTGVLDLVREKLKRANLPWAAARDKKAPQGICIYTAEGELAGNIVVYDTDYLGLPDAELAVLAVNALAPLVEALEEALALIDYEFGGTHSEEEQATGVRKALADLQEQLQKEQAGA